ESLTLIQTGKVMNFPVALVGTDYWTGLIDWMKARTLEQGMISQEDLDIFYLCDDPESVVPYLRAVMQRRVEEHTPKEEPVVQPHKAGAE
ncbi:MAG TPA: LOG family protein, partial [Actinomycetota bacterium]|nr:LOG family protein [Actinomycetota bacterium]